VKRQNEPPGWGAERHPENVHSREEKLANGKKAGQKGKGEAKEVVLLAASREAATIFAETKGGHQTGTEGGGKGGAVHQEHKPSTNKRTETSNTVQ